VEVIVGSGGFLGIDRKTMAIPPQSFTWNSAMTELQLNVGRDQLKDVPEFSLSHWPEATDIAQIKQVYQRYGVDPYFKDDQTPPTPKSDANAQSGQVTKYYSFNGDNALPRLGYISRASKLMGTEVGNMTNEKLARVEDFMVDLPAGRAVEVVLGVGSFPRANDELCAVPPQSFHWNADKTALTLDSTRDALKAAPHFNANEYELASASARVREVYAHYGVEPYFAMTDIDIGNGVQNVRERTDNPLTTLEQGNRADLKITDQIHEAVVNRENLSSDAKKVKIVTVDGTVTLIGTVASADEKRQIGELAAKVVPADKVDNQLQVRGASTLPTIPPADLH
jgi:hypothetical protein